MLTEDLLEVVRQEHAKVKAIVQQQQMELHQAQMQYAAYGYAVCILCSFGPHACIWPCRRNHHSHADTMFTHIRACILTCGLLTQHSRDMFLPSRALLPLPHLQASSLLHLLAPT